MVEAEIQDKKIAKKQRNNLPSQWRQVFKKN